MSKKDKSKFKKLIKAQLSESLAKAQTAAPAPVAPKKSQATQSPTSQLLKAASTTAAIAPEFDLAQIKFDLKKTAITVACLAAIIAIIYFLNQKHGILLTLGNWLFKVLHIG